MLRSARLSVARGKFLARRWEDGEPLVVKCGDEERDFRMLADPKTFFIPDHYRGYPTVLIHLPKVRLADLRDVLGRHGGRNTPKRLVAEYDQAAQAWKSIRRWKHAGVR